MENRLRQESFVSADGVRLVADMGGPEKAPAVVLMHGGGQTRHSWSNAVTSLLDAGYQVINYDARGHGDSDWSSSGAYHLSDRARDLSAIIKTIGAPFILVGASLGGATAIQAVDQGMRPAGLVLVDIVPEPEPKGIERIVSFMRNHDDGFANLEEAAEAVAAYNPDRPRPSSSDGLKKNLRERPDGRLRWHWDPLIVSDAPEVHHAEVQRAAQSLEGLPNLPVLLVRGLSSDVVSDNGVASFRKRLPRLQVADVAGAGHMVAGDRNDAFNDAILSFAKSIFS